MKIIQSDTLKTRVSALKKYADMITPTYGPAGKKVLIATSEFGLKAADDGHAASAEIELENEFENSVVMYMKESTEKTNSRVGDGTTTSVILTKAIFENVVGDQSNPFAGTSFHKEAQEIQKATKEAVAYIKNKAKKVESADELFKVAYNSYNNEEIARLIADTIFKIGQDGVMLIEDSRSSNTEVEMVEGLEVEKGFASPYLVNSEKEEVVLNEPVFLLVNGKLDRFMDVVPLLKKVTQDEGKKEFVVLAEGFGEDFLGNVIVSKVRGLFSPLLVEVPGFGDGKLENLKNISAVVGGEIFDSKVKKLSDATVQDLGTARKVVSRKDKTVIMGGNGSQIQQRVDVLQKQLDANVSQFEKDKIKKSIASLKGGVALIKVGADTENEQRSVKMKVEDAVNATRVAFKDGVVEGAGKTFAEIETSSKILNEALKAPRKQLEENGKEFLDENVTDPAGVLIAALETASSIAVGLLTMGGIVTTKRKEEKE